MALLSLPFARETPVRLIDNLFNVVSAISTTGLSTVSVADSYTLLGEFVLLVLFQLGGIGYMTTTSFIILACGRPLSDTRIGVFNAGFSLPEGFRVARFIRHIVIFSLIIEAVGAALLYIEFSSYGVAQPLWSAVFHSVSAFATAGFSLNNNSLEDFRASGIVNLTIGILCYLGAIGFIVLQDAYLAARYRRHKITFTSKVILVITALVLVVEMPLFLACEPSLRSMPVHERIYAAFFQIMAASTTSGFNSIPIGKLSAASLTLIVVAMVIGASPSGTGGGIKTTSLSVLLGIAGSTLRGRSAITFFRHQIPASGGHGGRLGHALHGRPGGRRVPPERHGEAGLPEARLRDSLGAGHSRPEHRHHGRTDGLGQMDRDGDHVHRPRRPPDPGFLADALGLQEHHAHSGRPRHMTASGARPSGF